MFKALFVGALVSGTILSSSSQAALIDVRYTGLITDGIDAGDFIASGSSLADYTIVVDYRFDTSLGAYHATATHSDSTSDLTHASPALSATITIAGRAVTFSGSDYGTISATSDAMSSAVSHEADASRDTYVYSSVLTDAGVFSASVLNGYRYDIRLTDNTTGYFHLADGTYGTFTPTSVVSAVPLPGALPLFAAGLIAFGAASGWRRRTRTHVDAA